MPKEKRMKEKINFMELLAPAGNYEKLLTAINYGADAIYLSGKNFGLRAFAGNFSNAELKKVCAYAHKLNKKIYVTINILTRDADYKGIEKYLEFLSKINVDSIIVSDLGLISFVRKNFPEINIHVSTQANVTNLQTALFLADLGVKRIVLARELSLKEIASIAKGLKGRVEIECFVHGAMCMAYSGRCLLSNYLTGRDANRGACVQACRWKYFIREESRDDELEVQEDEKGTYILNSKDLCMITHLPELQKAGVSSLKIEGRMKSSYYVACVTNAYRKAIDMLPKRAGDEFVCELEKTSHRRFTTGFYFNENDRQFRESSTPFQTHEFVAVVKKCKNGRATLEQRNFFKEGDILEVLSPNSELHNKTLVVKNMTNKSSEKIEKANAAQMQVSIDCSLPLLPGDILRKELKHK